MKRALLLPLIAVFILIGCGKKMPAVDIWTAAGSGNIDAIKQHIALGADIDAKDPAGGSSPLIVAALFGETGTASFLIENGASLAVKNNDGSTPLHVAAFFCHPQTVEMLLEQGADLDVRNNFGHTPLETVSGEWSEKLERIYELFSGLLKLELDMEQIKTMRPKIAELIRKHAGEQSQ